MNYRTALFCIALGASGIGLVGCGNVQFPSSAPPRDINTPPSRAVQASPTGNVTRAPGVSDASFVGASAVKVGPGDTVYELSRRHRVPVPAIIRANGLEPPYLLLVGQRIELPRGKQHQVVQNDTLYSIAQGNDVSVYELARLNGIDAPFTIRLGEILVIPSPDNPATAVASKTSGKSAPTITAEVLAPQQAPSQPAAAAKEPPSQSAATPAPSESAPETTARIAVTPPAKPPVPVPPPAARTGKGFIWPVRGPLLSNFGAKDGGLRNDGINIIAPKGAAVTAAENGVVAYAGNEIRGFGNLLLIKHDGGYVTAYAHNDNLLVERGQRVKRGQKIATVGSTGSVSRPQLHFEIRKGRRPQDPEKYLRRT